MSASLDSEQRHLIPRWRSLALASQTGELTIAESKIKALPFSNISYLSEQKQAWLLHRDLTHASDLLSSAFVLGLEDNFHDVAKFILQTEENKAAPTVKLANKILKTENRPISIAPEQIPERSIIASSKKIIDQEKYWPEIRKFRWSLKKEPKNPLAYLELGRLYSLVGEKIKAERCIERALYLDSNNRFILRSASRFYHHVKNDTERALTIVKKSEFLRYDPWLVSAEIAYSSILERHSKMAKPGIELIKKYNSNPLSFTELASSLGTLEFTNGKFKDSRQYFKKALIQPNDNSLAQFGWMPKTITDSVDVLNYNPPLAFEAKSRGFYHINEHENALSYAMRWYEDEPYSSRPVRFASYLLGTFLNDKKSAIKLLEQGRNTNPSDLLTKNNLVYYYALENMVDKAENLFEQGLRADLDDIEKLDTILVVATYGLLFYRKGEPAEGRKWYQKSISMARKAKNYHLVALATVNYIREELRFAFNYEERTKLINELNDVCKDSKEQDVQKLYTDVITDYERMNKEQKSS